jgi:hypothetical protein
MMNNDRSKDQNAKTDANKETDASGKRIIGRGMTSPDSTQVPLRAEDGEPDMDAIKGRIPKDDTSDRSSKR